MIKVSKYKEISISYPTGISHSLYCEYYFDALEEFINFNSYRFIKQDEFCNSGNVNLELYLHKGKDNFGFFMAWVHYCNTLNLEYLSNYLPD
jgi:hypothetical protein